MSDVELRPCPFCGQNQFLEFGQVYDQYMQVICNAANGGCGAAGGGEEFEEGAAKEWNTRHTPDGWRLVPQEMDRGMMNAAIPNEECDFPDFRKAEIEMEERWRRALKAAPIPDQGK